MSCIGDILRPWAWYVVYIHKREEHYYPVVLSGLPVPHYVTPSTASLEPNIVNVMFHVSANPNLWVFLASRS